MEGDQSTGLPYSALIYKYFPDISILLPGCALICQLLNITLCYSLLTLPYLAFHCTICIGYLAYLEYWLSYILFRDVFWLTNLEFSNFIPCFDTFSCRFDMLFDIVSVED